MKEDITEEQFLVISLYKCYSPLLRTEKALVLFNAKGCLIATGINADKLYFRYGWDLIDFKKDDRIYTYIIILPESVSIFTKTNLKYEEISLNINYTPRKQSISLIQQQLDLLRLHMNDTLYSYPLAENNIVIYRETNYIKEMRIISLNISKNEISVTIGNSSAVSLVKNVDWYFSPIVKQILYSLGLLLRQQFSYINSVLENPNIWDRKQKINDTDVYNLFLKTREVTQPSVFVFVRVNNNYLTFDDDAIRLTSLVHDILLYECNVIGIRGKTCTLLSTERFCNLKQNYDTKVVVFPKEIVLYKMGLRESFLNNKYNKDLVYHHVCMRKRMDGEYVVSAQYGSTKLPEISVNNHIAIYYSRLPCCLEKRAILSAIVHGAYDKLLSSFSV